jgi:hypothetical protein
MRSLRGENFTLKLDEKRKHIIFMANVSNIK